MRSAASALLYCLLCGALVSGQDQNALTDQAQQLLNTDPAKAAELYRQLLAQRPNWAEGWFYLGAALFSSDQNREALAAFQKGTNLAPDVGSGWGFLGMVEYRLAQTDRALADIHKGERLGLGANHGFETAVRQTGAFILIAQSRFDEAISQLQPLANFGIEASGVITAAGMCALALGQNPASLTPQDNEMVTLAGQAQWNEISRKPEQAQAAFQQLLLKFPDGRGVHYAYGLFLMESDQESALEQFHSETRAHPDFWPAWLVSANLETKNGTPDLALRDVEKARQSAPASSAWLCHTEAGRAYMILGKESQALNELRSAVKLHPDSPQLHHLLAQAYRRSGLAQDAEKENREFQRLASHSDPFAVAQ